MRTKIKQTGNKNWKYCLSCFSYELQLKPIEREKRIEKVTKTIGVINSKSKRKNQTKETGRREKGNKKIIGTRFMLRVHDLKGDIDNMENFEVGSEKSINLRWCFCSYLE